MAENVGETLQKLVQDVIAPDVCELKVEVASLRREIDPNHRELLAAIRQPRAHGEVVWQEIANLRERVAVLEAVQAR
jgi:hypothetical protein